MTQWTRVLRKVDEYRWEIPQDYKPGMRVPGFVYADEAMLRQIGQDQALEQVANVATLPGIVRYSLAMPDIHWGYGFPVGGVAALRADDGVISPGGVGYDINCIAGDSRVLHEFGYTVPIARMERGWERARLRCQDFAREREAATYLVLYLRRKPHVAVYRLTTETGEQIVATADHPFWTPDGMRPLRELRPGDRVAVYPFEGVEYEEPEARVLVDEARLQRVLEALGKGRKEVGTQIRAQLTRRGLLPLRLDSPALPYLLKLLGYLFGDGTLYFTGGTGRGTVWFYGPPEDLEAIRADIAALGFSPSRVYPRRPRHALPTPYGAYRFERTEHAVKVSSSALAALLVALGVPVGAKASQDFRLPSWLWEAPRWQQRLFLAAFFGAGRSTPGPIDGHGKDSHVSLLSLSKREPVADSGELFLQDVASLRARFGVEVCGITRRVEPRTDGTRSVRFRLLLSSRPESLVALWGRIGFEYNRRRHVQGLVAVQYLKQRQRATRAREQAAAVALYAAGSPLARIQEEPSVQGANGHFVERSVYGGGKESVRIGVDFPDFDTYRREATAGLGESGMVWARILSLEELVDFTEDVYDVTVAHPDHNFIANGFVVSNCGVRLLRTDLTEEEVRPRLRELVEELFRNVPSGVGSTGKVRVSLREVDDVLRGGARWAVERGFGSPGDLDSIEAAGQLPDADPDAVSPRAKERGKDQIGTLGSGNHFLEIQVVEEVYDRRAAEVMGLFVGQVVVFIHTGSRGLGYQVCEDYLRVTDRALKKYGITLPDRQLACAPFSSPEGQEYFRAMCCAANFAWANRQMITHWVRESFTKVLDRPLREIGLQVVYDVAHNIAKLETYPVNGRPVRLVVHRKGATRAFPPGHPEIPSRYREIGQPVLIPGDMGRYSFVAVGTERAMEETFGSTCHGAGRVRSRKAAVRELRGVDIAAELEKRGILVRAQNRSLLAEEASEAYKDVADVVEVCHGAGISRKVAKMRPVGVVKG